MRSNHQRFEDPFHVLDPLLRWHFRQFVLAYMRGNGELIFEADFAGLDMVRAITEGPSGKERFDGLGIELSHVAC